MVTLKEQMALDSVTVFANSDDFGESCTYLSPTGVTTNNVMAVVAKQSFVNEFNNYAGLSGTIAIARSTLSNVAIHGKFTLASGEVFTVEQIISIDDDFVTVSALADARISPQGMR